MHIQNLSNTPIEDLVSAILTSFEGYFVTMPSDTAYWAQRFQIARVDFKLSFGMFDGEDLVGFIIHGIDTINGELTAFNTGTGVVPTFRKQKIIDQLYAHAVPLLREKNVQNCRLEVIQENAKAIRVYERIGFRRIKNYHCFKGQLNPPTKELNLQKIPFHTIVNKQQHHYAWDNCNAAINKVPESTYQSFQVSDAEGQEIGFFVINPKSGTLPQFEIYQENQAQQWQLLFEGIAQISNSIRINNIDAKRTELIEQLLAIGLDNYINQFEMEWKI